METLDIFYQRHGIREIEHIEARPDHTVAMLKDVLVKKHGLETDTLIYLEDHETPLGDEVVLVEIVKATSLNIHLHRCHHVEAAVTFGGETVTQRFAPSATVARVKHWAAVKKFGMTEEEAGEHRLQIAGTQDRPTPGTHIGTLTACPACRVHFDLVPDERVNG